MQNRSKFKLSRFKREMNSTQILYIHSSHVSLLYLELEYFAKIEGNNYN